VTIAQPSGGALDRFFLPEARFGRNLGQIGRLRKLVVTVWPMPSLLSRCYSSPRQGLVPVPRAARVVAIALGIVVSISTSTGSRWDCRSSIVLTSQHGEAESA